MILCVVTSFFDSTMNRADIFVGMANYKTLFADPIFLGALKNTFVIVIVSVPITCIFSLWVSSAIVDLPEWATSLFRCVFYLPVVTGSVAVTVVWKLSLIHICGHSFAQRPVARWKTACRTGFCRHQDRAPCAAAAARSGSPLHRSCRP